MNTALHPVLLAVMLRKMKEQQLNPLSVDLKTYIDMRCFDNIGLKDIAEVFGYNPKYLSHYFKKKMNVTYSEYLRSFRFKYAISLFELGLDSVKNVGLL